MAFEEWTAQMCLHPLLKVPLTTMVPRQAVACDPSKAAIEAMQALKNLADARASWNRQLGQPEKTYPHKGVAKLGWSWEAMDVQAWRNKQELERALVSLVEQPGQKELLELCGMRLFRGLWSFCIGDYGGFKRSFRGF